MAHVLVIFDKQKFHGDPLQLILCPPSTAGCGRCGIGNNPKELDWQASEIATEPI
jgi:hypothetical protein